VKNIDERGRSPYMLQVTCNLQTLGIFASSCLSNLPAIPANKRFVVEYVNGRIGVAHNLLEGASMHVTGFAVLVMVVASLAEDEIIGSTKERSR